ncbi:MAG: phospholipase A [Candidatus Malihini olakiniferum]
MRKIASAIILLLAAQVQAEEVKVQIVHDRSIVRGGIIANLLQDYDKPFILYPYESNYLLYTYTTNINKQAISSYDWANEARKDEVNFQLSLAFPIWRGIIGKNSLFGFSYTQQSWWQMSNANESSPFRETNYEPQAFLSWAIDYSIDGWKLRDVEVGLNHQSNGKADPTSRSWDRAYVRLMAQKGNWKVDFKPWFLIPNRKNDNLDINKYLGYYRIRIGYIWGESIFSAAGCYNWNTGYGNAELGWSYPITKHVRFYTEVFSGYGESMIDYNHKQTRYGLGVMLNDIF